MYLMTTWLLNLRVEGDPKILHLDSGEEKGIDDYQVSFCGGGINEEMREWETRQVSFDEKQVFKDAEHRQQMRRRGPGDAAL